MKDIIITVDRQKKELKMIGISFILAFLLNVIAIIVYDTPWSEIFSQLLWVLIITALIYAVSIALRVILCCIKCKACKK